ncbi:MAG: type VI secretion system protein ImpA [Phycisphaerales bacterium]
MSIDLESLTTEISPDQPCGEDLVYDSAFIQFETDFAGKPEMVMGDSVQEAEDPDWPAVRREGLELLKRSRDLRLMVSLTVALMQTDGLEGMRDGLKLLKWALDDRWEDVHPKLDPDDDNDPLERVNILEAMSSQVGAPGDPVQFRDRFAKIHLISSRVLGGVTLRDIHRSENQDAPPGEDGDTADSRRQRITAISMDVDGDELTTQCEAMSDIVTLVKGIDDRLTGLLGASQAANFDGLLHDLQEADNKMIGWAGSRGGGPATDDAGNFGEDFGNAGSSDGGGAALSGEIRSISDVSAAFEKIKTYYDRHEPSSPVPVIVGMAQSLVGKSFLDIASAMSADAVETIERVREIAVGDRSDDD